MILLITACGGASATPTVRATIAPPTGTPATPAATATPDPTLVRGAGTVQENAASSRVLTIRTSTGLWYVPWDGIVLLDSPRGTLAPADIPIGAAVTFAGIPDPLAKTPTLKQVTIHIQ